MFEPAHRHNLLDLLRPPNGYRLDSAVGTTYSMDFVALTAVMLAFVDAEPEGEAGGSNQAELLRAITRLSHRVRIFANRGHIGIDRSRGANRLFCLFDRIVCEVKPETGCFHPKVWAARYTPKDIPGNQNAKPVIRLLCGSRNLTTSRCWEAFICLEGEELRSRPKNRIAAQAADFIKWLSISETVTDSLVNGLRHCDFVATKESRDRCEFLWQKPGENELFRCVPSRGEKAVLVSPFLRKTFVDRILKRFSEVTLISTQRELDAIDDEHFHETLKQHQVYVIRSEGVDAGSTALELHAKVFICEGNSGRTTMIGSANASDSAWRGRNCEALVSFSPGISTKHFREQFLLDDKGSLWGWVDKYERRPFVATQDEVAQDALENVREAMGRANLSAQYDVSAEELTFAATSEEVPHLLVSMSGQVDIKACPLALLDVVGSLKPIDDLFGAGLSFRGISIADLSEFIVLELSHAALDSSCVMVLKANGNFSHLMGNRDSAALKRLLTKENFQDFLQSILFDGTKARPALATDNKRGQFGHFGGELFHGATMEDILQSCTEDPTRIAEIDNLLKTFEGTDLVDPLFKRFWDAFRAAFSQAQEGLTRG